MPAKSAPARSALDTPGLAEHLEATTRAKVGIDQPNYSGLKRNS